MLRFTTRRVGETMLLCWEAIDLDRGELFIDHTPRKNLEERALDWDKVLGLVPALCFGKSLCTSWAAHG